MYKKGGKKKTPEKLGSLQGWKIGLEPTTFGTTIRRSNQLSYVHHVFSTVQRYNLFFNLAILLFEIFKK